MKIKKKIAKKVRKATGTEVTRTHKRVREPTRWVADPRDVAAAKRMERK